MSSDDVNDEFDRVLDTVQQLVGTSNTSRNKEENDEKTSQQPSSAEKWKKWKTEHLNNEEESAKNNSQKVILTETEKEHDADNGGELIKETIETVQNNPISDQDQDVNGNPDIILQEEVTFEEENRLLDNGGDDGGQTGGQTGGMIELSACGTVDSVVMQPFDDLDEAIILKEEDSVCAMIDLSSDEETEENHDVSVVLLRRPPAQENPNVVANDTIQIDDSDEEFPIFLDEAEKQENFNVEEKKGYVKDFIEREGLGILFSEYVHAIVHEVI